MSVDDITSFYVDDTQVHITVLLKDEDGHRYAVRDALGYMEAAHKGVSLKHRGLHPLIPDAAGMRA